ncbi:MAG: HAD family hydrolase [Phycisphaerae bacterium]|jgi:phosphoglycolate phosphatase-like HAD superfamily hydrolase|nr:HAD family hydrolase [Phycisphaerae bacterium]
MRVHGLVVFDIDGTLTLTSHVDDACYIRAVRDLWGIEGMSTDWSSYEHSTDNAIAAELFRRHRGRDATSEELGALRERFASYVREEAEREPTLFRQVPGAADALQELPLSGWHAAIATGGWTPSARCKLERAGVPYHDVPAAFACDARPREAIIRIASHRAAEKAGVADFERLVYVGDGVWDARACRRMGIPFVGIASGERAERLRAEGTGTILGDYREFNTFCNAVATARPPQ